MLIAFALSVILVCGLSLLIGRSISNALASMVSAMTRLAGGEVGMAIPGLGRRDEIGEMAGAVEVFKNNMIEAERLRAEQMRSRRSGRRSNARRICANSPMRSKARSERSSRRCPRLRPNWKLRPIR